MPKKNPTNSQFIRRKSVGYFNEGGEADKEELEKQARLDTYRTEQANDALASLINSYRMTGRGAEDISRVTGLPVEELSRMFGATDTTLPSADLQENRLGEFRDTTPGVMTDEGTRLRPGYELRSVPKDLMGPTGRESLEEYVRRFNIRRSGVNPRVQMFEDGGEVTNEDFIERVTTGESPLAAPPTRSEQALRAYMEAANPRVSVRQQPLGPGVVGAVRSTNPDEILLGSGIKQGPAKTEETLLHEMEHSLSLRGGNPLGAVAKSDGEPITTDNNYRFDILYNMQDKKDKKPESPSVGDLILLRRSGDGEKKRLAMVHNFVNNRRELEQFFGRPIDSSYFHPNMFRAQVLYGTEGALFAEQLADLSALEQLTGKSLTRDKEMRKLLFPDDRSAQIYDAITGYRQTRLDSKDLPPYTPVSPEEPGMLDRLKKLLGMNDGGEVSNEDFIEQMTVGTRPTDQEPLPYDQTAAAQFADYLRAPVDLAQTAVRGTIGSVVGPAYGLYKGVTGGKYGTAEGVREASTAGGELMQKITGEPKSQAAKDVLGFIGEQAEALKLAPMPQLMTAPLPGRGAVRFQGEAAKGAVEDIALRAVRSQTQNPDITAAQLYNAMLGKQAPGVAIVKPTGGVGSVPKATSIFEEIPTTRTTATQYGAEFVQSPFVGRLDKMIAELPGPVQKEQFLNQLKGKFRDYEIGRAKEALRDLPDNAKITPFDLLNRIKEDFDPSRYGTSIVKPDPNNPDRFFSNMDNIYNAPLGVIHLRQLPNPLVNADLDQTKQMYDALRSKTYGGIISDLSEPDVFNNYKNNINQLLRSINQPEKSEAANSLLDRAQSSLKLNGEISDAYDTIVYPTLSPIFKALRDQQRATTGAVDTASTVRIAVQSGVDKLESLFPGTKAKLQGDVQTLLTLDPATRTNAASNIASVVNPLSSAVNEAFRQNMTELRNLLENSYTSPKSPLTQFEYKGQHSGLGRTPTQSGIPNEIAFSRYSEHTTDVPDLGKVDGIYVHELQSDRLDDIRGRGPLGGSPAKDLPKATELRKKLQDLTEQAAVENQRYLDKPVMEQREKLREIRNQQEKTQQQLAKWMKRITEGDYKIKESFVGMEGSPQVIQQLMAKNVIAAAIQMGKNFVAFPGAESSQPQLYEKLPNNLKQVVKDLGPGFEYRPITLRTPDGQEVMHPAIVWDKYGAGKIGAEGVPFRKGGEVRTEDFIKKVLK